MRGRLKGSRFAAAWNYGKGARTAAQVDAATLREMSRAEAERARSATLARLGEVPGAARPWWRRLLGMS